MYIGLRNLPVIPELLYWVNNGIVIRLVIKIVDDLRMTGENTIVTDII